MHAPQLLDVPCADQLTCHCQFDTTSHETAVVREAQVLAWLLRDKHNSCRYYTALQSINKRVVLFVIKQSALVAKT